MKLFLKGSRCVSEKCGVERRPFPPGEGGRRRRKESEYRLQLREKQKVKRTYGVLEKQFRNYYGLAVKQQGITGENLLRVLESRLDNVIYRSGFASSRQEARQVVRHGSIAVNNRRVTIASYRVKSGDQVNLSANPKDRVRVERAIGASVMASSPDWLDVDTKKVTSKVRELPTRAQIDLPVQEQLIVELYSK